MFRERKSGRGERKMRTRWKWEERKRNARLSKEEGKKRSKGKKGRDRV